MQKYFRRHLIINLAAITVIILIFWAALSWLSLDVDSVVDKIVVDRTLIKKKAEAIGILAELKQTAPEAASYKKSVDAILPPQEQLLDFPRWLDGLARARRLNIGFDFQGRETPPQDASPGYAAFILNIGGALTDILAFVKDLELQVPRYLIGIEGFDLKETGEGYQLSTRGRVFFR